MNKGFFYYLHRSWGVTSFAYKRLGFFKKVELTLFLFVCYLGCLIFFLRPIFSIALTNCARMIEESHNLSVSKCFEGITKNHRFKDLLIADLYVFFLVLVICTFFFIPNLAFMFHPHDTGDVLTIVMITTISLASILSLIIEFKYLPLAYVASGTINTSAGDMLFNVRNMKGSAIWTQLLLIIFYGVLALLATGALVAGIIVVNNLLLESDLNWFWLILGLYILLPISIIFPGSLFLTMLQVSLYELYSDAVSLKKVYVVKEIAGTEIGYASVFPTEQDEVELIKEEKIGGLK